MIVRAVAANLDPVDFGDLGTPASWSHSKVPSLTPPSAPPMIMYSGMFGSRGQSRKNWIPVEQNDMINNQEIINFMYDHIDAHIWYELYMNYEYIRMPFY